MFPLNGKGTLKFAYHLLSLPVTRKRDCQWKASLLIDVLLQTLFIAPLYFSSCPSSISLPSTSHITPHPPLLRPQLYCSVLAVTPPPTLPSSLRTSECEYFSDPGPTLPWPWLSCSSGRAKIGRLTRPKEKVMGAGPLVDCVCGEQCDLLWVYMLCLAVPFGLWWRLRMASFCCWNYL